MDPLPIVHHEISEDRANRDAFRICVGLLVVMALALLVAGIVAWNTRIFVMPIAPRETKPARSTRLLTQFLHTGCSVDGYAKTPAGVRDFSRRVQIS